MESACEAVEQSINYTEEPSDPLTDSSSESYEQNSFNVYGQEPGNREESNSNIQTEEGTGGDGATEKLPDEQDACALQDLSVDEVMAMTFETIDDAENFYRLLSKATGFAIRRDDVKHENDTVIYRLWVCNRAGYRKSIHAKLRHLKNKKCEPRAIWKVDCGARFRVKFDSASGQYIVTSFVKDHNHELVSPSSVHYERSHRKISKCDAALINSMKDVGIPTRSIIDFMVRNAGGRANLGFTDKDVYNYIYRQQVKDIREGDAKMVLAYLNGKRKADPKFFFKYDLDEERRMRRLFWADSASRHDYDLFGDVLVFDSTYKNNAYHQPLVVLAGANNHYLTCVFACAIIADETDETYVWVLNSLMECMMNKHPKSVMTDGDLAMKNAIGRVFPNAAHRLCRWHLKRNATQHVHDPNFLHDFNALMKMNCGVGEFESRWRMVVEKYDLGENSWVRDLYKKKHKWAESYLAGHFFAFMRSTQRCEKMNSYLNKYLKSRHKLYHFMLQFEIALENLRDREAKADHVSRYSRPVLTTAVLELESHAAAVFTRRVFRKVRDEILKIPILVVVSVGGSENGRVYSMCLSGKPDYVWVVEYSVCGAVVCCTCGMMETDGIPCCHMIQVLVSEHVKRFPSCMILKRWTKNAKNSSLSQSRQQISQRIVQTTRYGALGVAFNGVRRVASRSGRSYLDTMEALRELGECHDPYLGLSNDEVVVSDEDFADVRDPQHRSTRGRTSAVLTGKGRKKACTICRNYGHNRVTCLLRQRRSQARYSPTSIGGAQAGGSRLNIHSGSTNYAQFNTATQRSVVG